MRDSKELKENERLSADPTLAAMERMELYYRANPGSPSATRRPQLLYRGQLWIASRGATVEDGIVGIGPTVDTALRSFDEHFSGVGRGT